MRGPEKCELDEFPGSMAPPGLFEAEAAIASRSVFGNNRKRFVQEVVSEVRLRLIKRYEAGNPPEDPPNWAWRVAHNYSQKLSLMERHYAPLAAGLTEMLCVLDGIELKKTIQAVLRLADIALCALAYPDERRLYDLYYRQKYHLEQVAATLDLSIIETARCWYRLMKKISYAVRAMSREDPHLNDVFARIINDKRCFHHFFINLLGVITYEGITAFREQVA